MFLVELRILAGYKSQIQSMLDNDHQKEEKKYNIDKRHDILEEGQLYFTQNGQERPL